MVLRLCDYTKQPRPKRGRLHPPGLVGGFLLTAYILLPHKRAKKSEAKQRSRPVVVGVRDSQQDGGGIR